MKNKGNRIGSFKEVNTLRGYDEYDFIDTFVPNSNLSKARINTSYLSQQIRILYSVIIYYLCPRTGSCTYFNKLDWYILWHLLTKQKLNLTYLIYKRILKNTAMRSLPYEMFLALLFIKLKVNLTNEKKESQTIVIKERIVKEKKRKKKKSEIR